ncbi:MAG: hypothetical protein GY803_02080 [Chloroflexi bacterium]|nr:hypothetical protein [Chloroflexota bacterium]
MMDKKQTHKKKEADLPKADDFTRINGIGPAFELCLRDAGIRTYSQLAALSPIKIDIIVGGAGGTSVEVIEKKDWIGQAKVFAEESAITPIDTEASISGDRQHYATFTVKLLLDEDNNVRGTRVAHVQGEVKDSWAGWQEAQLIEFIVQHAGLQVPTAVPTPPVEAAETEEMVETAVPQPVPPAADKFTSLRMCHLNIMPIGMYNRKNILQRDEPFDVRLGLDLADVSVSDNTLVNYTAAVYADSLSGGSSALVGQSQGEISLANIDAINVPGKQLTPGLYRLQAKLTLTLAGMSDLVAAEKGELLKVY